MRFSRRLIACMAAAALIIGLTTTALASDVGNARDVKSVRTAVAAKYGKPLHVSVSHDWSLCTAYFEESDLSVVLRRTGAQWKIVAHDGGAYDKESLKA